MVCFLPTLDLLGGEKVVTSSGGRKRPGNVVCLAGACCRIVSLSPLGTLQKILSWGRSCWWRELRERKLEMFSSQSSGVALAVDGGRLGIQPAEWLAWFIVPVACVLGSPALLRIVEGGVFPCCFETCEMSHYHLLSRWQISVRADLGIQLNTFKLPVVNFFWASNSF